MAILILLFVVSTALSEVNYVSRIFKFLTVAYFHYRKSRLNIFRHPTIIP